MNGPTKKTILFTFLTIFIFVMYPVTNLSFALMVNQEFEYYQDSSTNSKITQGLNNEEFVESFTEYWQDRYEEGQTNGTYSRWDTSVENGLYTFDKWEDTSTFDNSNNATIIDSDYENVLKCATFENASNEYCDSSDLDFDVIAPGGGFLTGWSYRKQIDITGSTDGDLTNYPMEFLLHYENDTDYVDTTNLTYNIYLQELANIDFSDIRFTDDTGTSLINHTFFQTVESNYTYVWVQVPLIEEDPSTTVIYIYYGNSGASTTAFGSWIKETGIGLQSNFDNVTERSDISIWEIDDDGSGNIQFGWGTFNGENGFYVDTHGCQPAGDTICYGELEWNNTYEHQVNNMVGFRYYIDVKIENIGSLCGPTPQCYEVNFNPASSSNSGWIEYTSHTNTVATAYTEKPYRFSTGYQQTSPNHPSWDAVDTDLCDRSYNDCTWPNNITGDWFNYGRWVVTSSNNAERFVKWMSNTTVLQPASSERLYVSPASYDTSLHHLEITTQGYSSGTSYAEAITWIMEFGIVNKTYNEPIVSIGSSVLGLNYVGYVNNSVEFIGGINRFFPAVNITEIANLEGLGAEVPAFEYFNFTMQIDNTDLLSGDALEFYLYTFNDSDVLHNDTLSTWTAIQIQEFWNITSQPIGANVLYTKDENFEEIEAEIFSFDLLDIADLWFENRTFGNTILGIGIQLNDLDQDTGENITAKPNSNYVSLSSYFAFDYGLQVDYGDISTKTLQVNVEPKEELITTTGFTYEQSTNTNFTNANFFEYSVAIETWETTTLVRTHFVKFYVEDPSGEVFLKWRTISGATASYSTGEYLEDDKTYRFTFDISKSDGRIQFSILNSTGGQLLRPTAWQSFTTSDSTERPSFFSEETLLKYYDGNSSSGDHRRGYSLEYKVGNSKIVTGDMKIHLDQIYSSAGLLDTRFFCKPDSNIPLNSCEDYSSGDFDDVNSYNAHWYNLSTNTRVTYQNKIRDFRHFRGIAGVNTSDTFSSDQYMSDLDIYIDVYPIWENGTIDPSEFVSVSLHVSNYSGGYNVLGSAIDNVSIPFWYPDLPAGKLAVNFAYGIYWVDERTLGLTVKYFDTGVSTSNPVTLSTYGNYDETTTQDVLIVIQYQIIGGNNYNTDGGNIYIREDEIVRGRSRPFEIPSIPNPDVPFIPPNLWDDIVSGIGGFTDSLLSGDLFGALGGAFESFINAILGIGGLIVGAIFTYIVPWFQTILYAILDWALDSFGYRDLFTTAQQFTLYIIANLVLLWLFIWALCLSGPFIYAVFGERREAPKLIFEGATKIWLFDAKFGILNAVLPKFYLIAVAIISTIYYATIYDELSFVLDWFPFTS